nr:Aerobic glycerol-3-phosphate dehydrogenase [Klebsiella pneumoniae]
MIRIGLFMYDHLGKRTSLPDPPGCVLAQNRYLNRKLCAVSNIPTAGSTMPARCWPTRRWSSAKAAKCVPAPALSRRNVRMACGWWKRKILIAVRSLRKARGPVNATGPWVKQFFDEGMHLRSPYGIRLIKGSHIVVPRVHTQKQAYILQNEDKRIVFVIPWMDEFSIIGTTDVEYKGDPKAVAIDDKEINYLLNVYNAHFKRPSAGTISSGPTPASVRCATTSRIRRRPLPATIPGYSR